MRNMLFTQEQWDMEDEDAATDAGPGSGSSGGQPDVAIPAVPAFNYLLYTCLFCGSGGRSLETRADWCSKQMCIICYRRALIGWRTLAPKDLLRA